jgi:hypothetical protein
MQYKFKSTKNLDSRAAFANRVCSLLIDRYSGDINIAVEELNPIYNDFYDNVRNIYELIDTEIPLFALFELRREDAKYNFGFTDKQLKNAIKKTLIACEEYYLKK